MRRFFEPASAPSWLKQVLSSVRSALSDPWPTPLRLFSASDLPEPEDWSYGLLFATDSGVPAFSDGVDWYAIGKGASLLIPSLDFSKRRNSQYIGSIV